MQIILRAKDRGGDAATQYRKWDVVDILLNSEDPGASVILPTFAIIHTPGTDETDIRHLKDTEYDGDGKATFLRKWNLTGLPPGKITDLENNGSTIMALAAILNSQVLRSGE